MIKYSYEGNIRAFWALRVVLRTPKLLYKPKDTGHPCLTHEQHAYKHTVQHNFTSPMNNPAKNAASQFHDLLNSQDLFLHSTPAIHSLDHIITQSLPIIPPTISLFAQFPLVFLFNCSLCNQSANSMSYPSLWAPNFIPIYKFLFFPPCQLLQFIFQDPSYLANTLSFLIPFYFVYKHHLRHTVVKNKS